MATCLDETPTKSEEKTVETIAGAQPGRDPLAAECSFFASNTRRFAQKNSTVAALLADIRRERWKPLVEPARIEYQRHGKSDEYDLLKNTLPAFTVSGTFSRRKDEYLLKHSGILLFDIDEQEDLEAKRKIIENDRYTLFCFASVSGGSGGLKVGVRITAAGLSLPEAAKVHGAAFEQGKKYYTGLGIIVDATCSDLVRLCYVTYDKYIFINPNAVIFPVVIEAERERTPRAARNTRPLTGDAETERIRRALALIDPDPYDTWIKMGMALHTEGRRDLWDEWSSASQKYNQTVQNKKWGSFHDGDGVSMGSLFHLARENGFKEAPAQKARKAKGAGTPGDAKPATAGGDDCFWYSNDNGVQIYQSKISEYLHENGFTQIYLPGEIESIFVRIMDHVVSQVTTGQMRDFFMKYARSLPPGKDRFSIIEKLERGARAHFGPAQLGCIQTANPQFVRDTKSEAYFYFSNGFTIVTKNRTTFHEYSELHGAIWERQKLDREYRKGDTQTGEFERFLFNVCGEGLDRFMALRSAIGYLLHRWKNRSLTKAIVFLDEAISDTPEGRSGKSIVSTALCKLRNGLLLDGKKMDFGSPFVFQSVQADTELVVMDDVKKNFDYEAIFHMITSDFETERKGQHSVTMPFEDAPKVLISTNYMLAGEGGSAEARKAEYEFSAHYHAGYSPRDDFGHNLFDDWTTDEWARFDQFMMDSVTLFLQSGLIQGAGINIAERKLLQNTRRDFVDFMDEKHKENEFLNKDISKNSLFNEFNALNPEGGKYQISAQKFNSWLKAYGRYKKWKVQEETSRNSEINDGKPTRCIKFTT